MSGNPIVACAVAISAIYVVGRFISWCTKGRDKE